MTGSDASPAPSAPLTMTQIAILVVYGALLWFSAAMLIRLLSPIGALDGQGLLLTYVLTIPGTLPFVYLMRKITALRTSQTAIGIALVTGTAALFDGNALVLFPSLYGANTAVAGAVILWGAGVGLVEGVILDQLRR